MEDIPIDPALLEEEAQQAEYDLEDAEGEAVDEDMELIQVVPTPCDEYPPAHEAYYVSSLDHQLHQPQPVMYLPTKNPRASSSRLTVSAGDVESISNVSSSAKPARPRKRSRPSKSQTATLNGGENGRGKGKGKAVQRDTICSFCAGTDQRNRLNKSPWYCPICLSPRRSISHSKSHPASTSRTVHSQPTPRMGNGKGLVPRSEPAGRRRGRPSIDAFGDDVFDDHIPKLKLRARGKGKEREQFRAGSESPPVIKVRLRVLSGGGRQTIEPETEEERIPYGGVITGDDADMSKTTITEKDKEAFDKSRTAAETKLGGPPVPMWDPTASFAGSPAATPRAMGTPPPGRSTPTPAVMNGSAYRPLRDRLLLQTMSLSGPADSYPFPMTPGPSTQLHHPNTTSTSEKVKTIRFGTFDIDTWYAAPYPEEYASVPDGRLWLCEFCLKYMKSGFVAGRHRMKCKARHPPGDEIYRDGSVSVFEVDGRKNKIYCQNLCLLAKMFLDHKTLYYDVEPFLFYVMTEVDDIGARFVGYFSKEKRSPVNNVSCIMTLPVRQRKGWGQLLIDFSYLLTKKEGRVGSPEKPLSGLGALSYKSYWTLAVFQVLQQARDDVTMDEISAKTAMTLEDVYSVLKDQNMISILDVPAYASAFNKMRSKARGRGSRGSMQRRRQESEPEEPAKVELPTKYQLVVDREYIDTYLAKFEAKEYLKLKPDRLKYTPFLVTRDPLKPPPATIAMATTEIANGNGDDNNNGNVNVNGNGNGNGTSDSTSSREVVSTPLEMEHGRTPEKIVNGEDDETLALVATLAHSPQRSLRKRPSPEIVNSGGRNTRSKMSEEEGWKIRSESHGQEVVDDAAPINGGVVLEDDMEYGEEDAEGEDEEEYSAV
ncbi:histone acetyltransferase SAS3, partial [Tremellales sp. Uapishka_1]